MRANGDLFHIQHLRHFARGQTFDVPQHNGFAFPFRQPRDSGHQQAFSLILLEYMIRARSGIGMLQIGVVNVPLYLTLSSSEFKFILNDAEVKYVFVSDESLFKKIQEIKSMIIRMGKTFQNDQQ